MIVWRYRAFDRIDKKGCGRAGRMQGAIAGSARLQIWHSWQPSMGRCIARKLPKRNATGGGTALDAARLPSAAMIAQMRPVTTIVVGSLNEQRQPRKLSQQYFDAASRTAEGP